MNNISDAQVFRRWVVDVLFEALDRPSKTYCLIFEVLGFKKKQNLKKNKTIVLDGYLVGTSCE